MVMIKMDIFEIWLITAFVQTFGAGQCHVAKCLNEIALRHFKPEVTLVIVNSCHEQQRNNQQLQRKFLTTTSGLSNSAEFDSLSSALEELHQKELWTLLVCNTCYEVKHGTRSKHNNYILLFRTTDLIREMRNQLRALKDSPEWNPRANFVVILTQRCLPPIKQSDFVDEILTEFSNWNIMNVIVLVPTQTSQLQSIENETNKSCKRSISEEFLPILEVYAWVPRQPLGLCGQVTKGTLINVWASDGEDGGHFLYEMPLFGQKILGNFHGCPIRVSAFDYSPFFIQDINSEKHKDTVSFGDGLEFRLLHTITRATNMSVAFDSIPVSGDLWGRPLQNGSWTGVLGQVLSGSSDVAMCSVYYVCHLNNDLECSTPYVFDETLWCIPCPKPIPHWLSLTRVFEPNLWLVFILSYVIYSPLMWISVTLNNMQGNKELPYTSISKCFFNLWAVILGVSVHDKVPNKTVIRTSFVFWVLYSLVLNTVYQTLLTTFLIEPGLEHEISTVNELLESGMEMGFPRTIDTVLPELTSKRYFRHTFCTDMSLCFHRLAFEGNFAVVCSKYNTEYDIARKYTDSTGKSLICHLHETFSLQFVTLTVQKGSLLLDEFNRIISHVLEAGLMSLWWKDLKYKASLSAVAAFTAHDSERTAMKTEHFQSAFFVLAFGLILAMLCFVCERLHRAA
jgi:hypothetical protein